MSVMKLCCMLVLLWVIDQTRMYRRYVFSSLFENELRALINRDRSKHKMKLKERIVKVLEKSDSNHVIPNFLWFVPGLG